MKFAAPFAAALVALSLLAGCVEPPLPEIAWKPRAGADLKADQAVCKKDVDDVDFHNPGSSHYAAVAAMASRTDEVDLTSASIHRMRDAVMYQCMTEKGWMPAS